MTDLQLIQSQVPSYLSPQGYKVMSDAAGLNSYVTMDPNYAFSQNVQTPSNYYGQYNVTTEDQKNANQQAANASGNAWGLSQGYGQPANTNQATPGALDALKAASPDLQNRKPSLAAGQGGWDPTSTGTSANNTQGNANYTYYSRFA